MAQIILSRIVWFIFLLALQALVCNHIHILGYATPMPYLYLLLILPNNVSRLGYIFVGFILGLCVDTSTNTPGMAAAALTLEGLLIPWLLKVYVPIDSADNVVFCPSVQVLGWGTFLRLASTVTIIHCIIFFSLEAFNLFSPIALGINILGSSGLTMLFIVAFELMKKGK